MEHEANEWWEVSCSRFSGLVITDSNGIITGGCREAQKFVSLFEFIRTLYREYGRVGVHYAGKVKAD